MCPRLLSTALLLIVSSGIRAGFQKAVVILDPTWVRVLKDDSVTLRCQATNSPGDNSTKWFHNGSLIPHQYATYVIRTARVEDSGEYKCQTALSVLSDPVNLEVHVEDFVIFPWVGGSRVLNTAVWSVYTLFYIYHRMNMSVSISSILVSQAGWLLLQTTQRPEFQEGDPIRLNCHSWQSRPVYKVTYLQNGRGKKYFHQNSELYIPKATQNHSGSYFCRGIIGRNNKSSEALRIIVRDPTSSSTSPPWPQITFCLLTGLLFAVDTVLCFSVQRDLRRSVADYEEPELHWSKEPEDKTTSAEKKSFRSSKADSEAPGST